MSPTNPENIILEKAFSDELSSISYDTWFAETTLYKLEDGVAYIIVPMPIHKKHLQDNYYDLISNKNLASKRLAIVYEYIYTKYPYFLANNPYLNNKYYQNFLLTSENNRKLLEEKVKTGSKKTLHYE